MCVFVALFRVLPGCPLLILSNRDEQRSRPTQLPQIHTEGPQGVRWLGGRDEVAGGTWLGLNEFGVIVAVTNRPKAGMGATVRSRGLLCRELLVSASVDEAAAMAERQLDTFEFAGFNLLLLSASKCVVFEEGDVRVAHTLSSGIHAIANRGLNDVNDRRTQRAMTETKNRLYVTDNWQRWMNLGGEICSLPESADQPGLCLTEPNWGTVSSTIIALPEDATNATHRYAPGPPSASSYVDYSVDVRQLLTPTKHDATMMRPLHRMHLHGPWQFEWADEAGRVKMPAEWKTIFGERTGTVVFRRRFGRPTNLEPHERVFVAFDGIGGSAQITVNGKHFGAVTNNSETARFDVTDILEASNLLEVELTINGSEQCDKHLGLWAPIAIEIHQNESLGERPA